MNEKPKWNVFFAMKGPGGTVEAPSNTNPIESDNLESLLTQLAQNLPGGAMSIECIGIRVELDGEGLSPR